MTATKANQGFHQAWFPGQYRRGTADRDNYPPSPIVLRKMDHAPATPGWLALTTEMRSKALSQWVCQRFLPPASHSLLIQVFGVRGQPRVRLHILPNEIVVQDEGPVAEGGIGPLLPFCCLSSFLDSSLGLPVLPEEWAGAGRTGLSPVELEGELQSR